MALNFLVAGTPLSTQPKNFQQGLNRVKELGLDGEEIQFGHSVFLREHHIEETKNLAQTHNLALTIHGPYYINLNAVEEEKIEASVQRIVTSAQIGYAIGAKSVCFHPAYRFQQDREAITQKVRTSLEVIEKTIIDEQWQIDVRPETAGKKSQFGLLEEIIDLCEGFTHIKPCIDFAHLMATSDGQQNTYEAFCLMLETIQSRLGKSALQEMHIHAGSVAFSDKGELHALNLDDPDSIFDFRSLLQALIDYEVGGWIVAETPNIEQGALLLQQTYTTLRNV